MTKLIKDIKKFSYQTQFNKYSNYKKLFKNYFLPELKFFSLWLIFIYIFLVTQLMVAAPISKEPIVKINKNLLAQNSQQNLSELKKKLESELKSVLGEIEKYRKEIQKLSKEKRNLQQEIAYLNAKIAKLELEMKLIKSKINNLNIRIADTQKAIDLTKNKIENSKNNLVKTLRVYYQSSRKSFFEVVLAEAYISDYFSNIVFLNKLQESINEQINDLNKLNQQLNYQKEKLENDLEEQNNLLQISTLQKIELDNLQNEKNELLRITQGEERKFNKLLSEKQRRAAEIRAQLFRLAGGAAPITFEKAVEYAEIASQLTGIRPAFLLAVLKQESDLGKNVGQCYLQNTDDGSGIHITTGQYRDRVMHPKRDVPIFLEITKKLGLDPFKTQVSCPLSFGWGGAMGPAQFIPSTWRAYENKIEKILGETPNPWNIYHAFIAAAVKLTDAGASQKTYQSEWKAAMIYFAGSNWSNPSYSFYGDSVMSLASRFEEDIKIIKGKD
jgi:peptidoglycan hydrolase CwlO-like protein